MSYALDGGKSFVLNFEIGCGPFAVLHVQLLKRAAASFILFSFCVLMAIQLVA